MEQTRFHQFVGHKGVAFLHRGLFAGAGDAEAGVARVRTIELLFEAQVLRLEGGEDPFICAINGRIALDPLCEIEEQLRDEEEFSHGEGLYLYEARYFSGQYGEYGMCEIAPGWELTLLEHNADWMTPVEGSQP